MEEEYLALKNEIKKKIPGIESFMENIKMEIAPSIINIFQESTFNKSSKFSKYINFKLKLVIDNNILFSQIYSSLKNNKNIKDLLLYKLAINPSNQFYAPPFIKKEIFKKINEKFKVEDRNKAKEFAKELLAIIKIKEAKWVQDWIKAKKKIGHIDPDDIPYLALCFDLKSDGIISEDKVFDNVTKKWKINEVGEITGEFNNGMFSLFFLGQIPNLAKTIYHFTSLFLLIIYEVVKDFIKIIFNVLKYGISYLNKIPNDIKIFGSIAFLLSYFLLPNFNKSTNLFLKSTKELIEFIISNIKNWINQIIEFTKNFYSSLKVYTKNIGIITIDLFLDLLISIEKLQKIT